MSRDDRRGVSGGKPSGVSSRQWAAVRAAVQTGEFNAAKGKAQSHFNAPFTAAVSAAGGGSAAADVRQTEAGAMSLPGSPAASRKHHVLVPVIGDAKWDVHTRASFSGAIEPNDPTLKQASVKLRNKGVWAPPWMLLPPKAELKVQYGLRTQYVRKKKQGEGLALDADESLSELQFLVLAAIVNFVRDWHWGMVSAQGVSVNEQVRDCGISMLLACFILGVAMRCFSGGAPWKNLTAIYAGALVAIPFWDKMQTIGQAVGKSQGMSLSQANHFSGVFTGAEGLEQYVVIEATMWFLVSTVQRQCQKQPFSLLPFVCAAIIGNAPGNLWEQVNEWAKDSDPVTLGYYIALVVAAANVGVGLITMKILSCWNEHKQKRARASIGTEDQRLLDYEHGDAQPMAMP